MQSWIPRTRSQYASRLRALAAYADRTGPPDTAAALAGLLAERAQAGATALALRGITSAVRAVEDLQWLPPTVTTLHKRIAAGAASSGSQPYLSPAGLVQLVEKARDSRHGAVFSALAIISWVCYLRVGEAAGIRVTDLAMPGFVQFWNSKTGEEGYTTRPLYRYADSVRAWLHGYMVSLGRSSDMLVWQSGEAGLEAGMADALASTAHFRAHGPVTRGLCRLRNAWASWPCGDPRCSPVSRAPSTPRPSASRDFREVRSWNPLRAARLGEETMETKPRPSWRDPHGTALLRWAWGLTQLLPPLHFLLWPLPLSAAPCLGKMRVSCARWRGLWWPWGGGRAGWGRQPGPSMSIPTWTPTTTARIPEASPLANSQSAAPGAPPGVDRPELPGSLDGSVSRGPPGQPLAQSEEDPQRARKLEWWAVSTAHTRGRVALRWSWMVRRPCDPEPPHAVKLGDLVWPSRSERRSPSASSSGRAGVSGRRRRKARWRVPSWLQLSVSRPRLGGGRAQWRRPPPPL